MAHGRVVSALTAVLTLALLAAAVPPVAAATPAAAAAAAARGGGVISTDTEVMANATFPALLRQLYTYTPPARGTRTCRCAPLPVPPGGMCVRHLDGTFCTARPCTPAWTCLYGPPHGPSPATTVCRVTSRREDWVCDRNDWGASKLCPCSLRRSRKTLVVPIARA